MVDFIPIQTSKAIHLIANKYQELVTLLEQSHYDAPYEPRIKALNKLEKLDSKDLPLLLQALNHNEDLVCHRALSVTEEIVKKNGFRKDDVDATLPKLISASNHRNQFVRGKAITFLGDIGEQGIINVEIVRTLANALDDREENVRHMATFSIARIVKNPRLESLAGDSLSTLRGKLDETIIDPNDHTSGLASFGMRQLRRDRSSENRLQILLEELKNEDPGIRMDALYELGKNNYDIAQEKLIEAIQKDLNEDVRIEAAFELRKYNEPSVIEVLSTVLENDLSYKVRSTTVHALSIMAQESKNPPNIESIIPLIIYAFRNDSDERIRDNAYSALQEINACNIENQYVKSILSIIFSKED